MGRVHPRVEIVDAAHVDFLRLVIDFKKKHDLTPTEWLGMLMDQMQVSLKYALRAEGHPDEPDKPSGWE